MPAETPFVYIILGAAGSGRREVLADLEPQFLAGQSAEPIERFAFYERTKQAFAIVLTGELQPFGNFLLRKGVIGDALRP